MINIFQLLGFGFMSMTTDSANSPKSLQQSFKSTSSGQIKRSPTNMSSRAKLTKEEGETAMKESFAKESFEIRIALSTPTSPERKVISAHVHESWTVREVIYVVAEAGKVHLHNATGHPNVHVADKHSHVRLVQNSEPLPMDAPISQVAKRPASWNKIEFKKIQKILNIFHIVDI